MAIYGRETIEYTYSVIDVNSAVQASTLDWLIADTMLDGTNNDTVVTDSTVDTVQDKVYESKGAKTIDCEIDMDDGWGNIYQHTAHLDVEALVYEEPVLAYSWLPVEPTIIEEVTFTQGHDDIRDDSIPKQYGRIDKVSIDYYNDGSKEEVDQSDSYEFKNTFTVKQDGIVNRMEVEYWDGWESQTAYIDNTMQMSNIPPVSDHVRVDNGVCIPAYDWTAQSDDLDDDNETLSYSWKLYKNNDNGTPDDTTDDVWDEVDSGTEITYTYPFQFEGDYKLVLRTTDIEGDWHEKIEEFPIVFDSCSSGSGACTGTIVLQPDRFQAVAIPVAGRKVNEYFLDKIAETIGADANTVINLVKSYPSSDASTRKFQVFVPGLTNPLSSTNFELVQTDGAVTEITPFYVHTKEFPAGMDTIEFNWDTADAIQGE